MNERKSIFFMKIIEAPMLATVILYGLKNLNANYIRRQHYEKQCQYSINIVKSTKYYSNSNFSS